MYECHTCEYKTKEKRCSILNRDLHGSLKTQGCGVWEPIKIKKALQQLKI